MVYVISKEGKPLMPCSDRKARHLLKNKKARVFRYTPFTIQLNFKCENKVQPTTLGVDSGSKKGGLSVVSNDKELYSAEFEIRGSEIVELLSKRRMLRRTRRSRKTRYREVRFLNRKRKDNWLTPSVRSKINAHKKLISDVHKTLPVNKTIVEVASFDIQKIKNPEISGTDYQKGEMYGWNVREYVLWRDNHQCQGRNKCPNKILITHHIESRQIGGNAPNNLITLCKECHDWHHKEVRENRKGFEFRRGQSFKHQAFMGIMRWKLYNELKEMYKNVSLTYGYITKNKRIRNGLEKSHRTDALCIAGNVGVERSNGWWQIKQVRKKKRNLHEVDPRKGRGGIRQKYNTKQIIKKKALVYNFTLKCGKPLDKDGYPIKRRKICFQCKKKFCLAFSLSKQNYSRKHFWTYWTEKTTDNKKYICSPCLRNFYLSKRKEFLETIKNPQKRNNLRSYISDKLI